MRKKFFWIHAAVMLSAMFFFTVSCDKGSPVSNGNNDDYENPDNGNGDDEDDDIPDASIGMKKSIEYLRSIDL